ncbi:hypothetical protein JOY44_07370 [Phormidium sp. CLA17]|uniref:hypothetical protein n=1 Tax=Leptolyngbya sp. Cla-17 TaxID=2803751 RepID=UPI001490CE76|nr:hypothetical protein [Leptolyngbya sp. Cla-17]MBM0741438.1 hypothetical protein [Leptolyngbya sp. Cla-17]
MAHKAIDRFRPQASGGKQGTSEIHSSVQPPDPEAAIAEAEGSEIVSQAAQSEAALDAPEADTVVEAPAPKDLEQADNSTSSLVEAGTQRHQTAKFFTQVTLKLKQGAKTLGTPLVWLGVVAFCGGTGVAAISWLTDVPPNPNCQQLWFFSSDTERLFCAEQAARSSSPSALLAGLKLIEPWHDNHTLEKPAKRLMRDWSKTVLAIARQKAGQNNLKQAIYLVSKIPANSPFYRNAQQAENRWRKSQIKGKALEESIESALKKQDWQKAETLLLPFANQQNEYWQQQFIRMRERMMTERLSYNQLQAIRTTVGPDLSKAGEKLGPAIAEVEQLHPKTYARASAEDDVIQWSKALTNSATQQLEQGNLSGAIAQAKWLPVQSLSPDLQNLIWLDQATQLNRQMPAAIPTEENYWQIATTLSALRQIQPRQPLYTAVQPKISPLEDRLQDLTQLRFAKFVADARPLPLLPLAIQIAQAIAPTRPHRLYAQTLISVWQQDQQQMSDRANIIAAEKFAALGTPQSLNNAIAYASKVPLGRPLRLTAQSAIFDWKQRLLDLEDQTILDQAQKLATSKQYAQAIQLANKIGDGRPLYNAAQTLVQQWSLSENGSTEGD